MIHCKLSFLSLAIKKLLVKEKKKRRFLSNKCLSSIISNIINNKNEPGKTVRLTNFSELTTAIRFNLLPICPSVTSFAFAHLDVPSFNVLSVHFSMFTLNLVVVPVV